MLKLSFPILSDHLFYGYLLFYDVEDTPRQFTQLKQQIKFVSLQIENHKSNLIPANSEIAILIKVKCNQSVPKFRFSMTLFRIDGIPVGSFFSPDILAINQGETAIFRLILEDITLAPGIYYFNSAIGTGDHVRGFSNFDHVSEVLNIEICPQEDECNTMSTWHSDWGSIRFKHPSIFRVN